RGLRGDDVCDRSRWWTNDQPSVPPTLAPKLETVEAGDHRQKQRQYRPPATSKVYRDDRPVLVIVPLEADERARAHARQSAHQSGDDDPLEPYPLDRQTARSIRAEFHDTRPRTTRGRADVARNSGAGSNWHRMSTPRQARVVRRELKRALEIP